MVSAMGEHRAGFVAVAGRTNVGKSTLVNRLVGHKVAIVTPRPQTTRRRILGIRSDDDAQILLIDTPGLHEAKKQLNQRMVQTARRAIAEGEVLLAVVEAGDRLNPGDRAVLVDLRALGRPTIIAINKSIAFARAQLLPLIEEISQGFPSAEIVPVSALTGENFGELLRDDEADAAGESGADAWRRIHRSDRTDDRRRNRARENLSRQCARRSRSRPPSGSKTSKTTRNAS